MKPLVAVVEKLSDILKSKAVLEGRGLNLINFGHIAYRFRTMLSSPHSLNAVLVPGSLRRVHHIALNVRDMKTSRHFYGHILGLHELKGEEVPKTLVELVAAGKVANFVTPDGTVLDLFWEPDLAAPDPDPKRAFTRANHLAFDIAPELFERAIEVLRDHQVPIDHGPVSRPTGRGIYFYDPDGFLLEIRCDPIDIDEAP